MLENRAFSIKSARKFRFPDRSIPFIFLSLLVFSCSSVREPREVFVEPDYTEEDVRRDEIAKIDALVEKNPVQALWRACLLDDADTKDRCFSAVASKFERDAEEKNWYSARSVFRTLKALGYPKISSLSKTESELERLATESVPGLSSARKSQSLKVSSYISGTVTIWVDKGIAIQNGYGYADRVIGSGFFISEDGYLITNNHVIEDVVNPKNEKYTRLFIKLAEDSDTRIPAKVVGHDPILDLALLKTEVAAPFVFSLGSSEGLDVGDKIYAIGSPIGLERTLTSGIVSATDRKLFTLGSVMQIDAAVNSGNSGGPCIDPNGNVQAVVFAGVPQYQGLNFAIPVEYLKAELPALFAGGKLEHPWIAAYGHTKKLLGRDAGLEVQYVLPGGSAGRVGLKAGDVIVEADFQKVATLEDFQNILIRNSTKSVIDLKFVRNIDSESPEEIHTKVYLSVRPENPGKAAYNSDMVANSFVPIFGMRLTPLTQSGRRKYSVSSVVKGGIADESGFSENDYIEVRNVRIDDEKSVIYAEIYAKNRRKGYLDASMMLGSQLDNPFYF